MSQGPGRRRLPFLHRNWTAGVTASQEWNPKRKRQIPAAAPRDAASAISATLLAASGLAADEHPSKRRRVLPPQHLPGAPGAPGVKSLPGMPGNIEDLVKLPQCPGDRSNGLRIQVSNVFHQDTPRLRYANNLSARGSSELTRYNARFKVTIYSEKSGRAQVMYCNAQIGAVHAIRASNGPYGLAKLVLEPFTVPLEKIAVLHHDGAKFGLADKYILRIEIESTTSNEPWPPLDLLSLTGASRRGSDYRPKTASDCVLYAESTDFFGRPRMRVPLWLRENVQHSPVRTNFVVDMDVRWTTGFLERPRKAFNLGTLPTIVALHPDEPLPPPSLEICGLWPRRQAYLRQVLEAGKKKAVATSEEAANVRVNGHINDTNNASTNGVTNGTTNGVSNGTSNGNTTPNDVGQLQNQVNDQLNREINDQINGHSSGKAATTGASALDIADGVGADGDDDLEWPTTPSRSLRARRDQPEYNVRTITNKAHKITDRGGRRRGGHLFAGLNGHANGAYGNGSNSHIKVGYTYQQDYVRLDGFQCCICMAMNPDLDQLRLHFRSHSHYSFQYEHRPSARGNEHNFKVTRVPDSSNVRLQDIVYQLNPPTKALDLEKFLQGDESWLASRYGPLNDDKVVKLAQAPRPKIKPAMLRVHTPTPAPQKPRKNILVPSTRQPLYDPLSKALLKPGSNLRTNIVDDSWRIHKHREIVQDYTDLTPAEKDFIMEWDRFIILKRIASDAYIPRAMVQFIEEKGLWLVSDLDRTMEFGKLMAVMIAHDILTDADVDNITQAMDKAWALKASIVPGDDQALAAAQSSSVPKVYAPRGGTGGCPICGFRCAVADSVICSNKECARRQYHTACLGKTAIVNVEERGEWYCNNCAHLADPAHLVRSLEKAPAAAEAST